MVGEENVSYRDLLRSVKKRTGYGVVLNTSFNIHGMPIVASPKTRSARSRRPTQGTCSSTDFL